MNGLNELLPHLYPFFFLLALFILMYKMVGWARKRKVAAVAAGVLVQMLLPDPNVEKTIQKFQQLAKDAQSSGDPVLVENYLQHADHYARRLAELNERTIDRSSVEKTSDRPTTEKSDILNDSKADEAPKN